MLQRERGAEGRLFFSLLSHGRAAQDVAAVVLAPSPSTGKMDGAFGNCYL